MPEQDALRLAQLHNREDLVHHQLGASDRVSWVVCDNQVSKIEIWYSVNGRTNGNSE
jgi:hypothetical protein